MEVPNAISWLHILLEKTFFIACRVHTSILGNLKNQYCIDCETSACNHCTAAGTHTEHRVLTIYRHVCKEVVALDEISRHINCSGIQTHVCNERQVIGLHPLPHNYSGSSKMHKPCLTCTQQIMKHKRYQYCSIACKFLPNIEDPKNKETTSKPSSSSEEDPKPKETTSKPPSNSESKRRKGQPVRAPMF